MPASHQGSTTFPAGRDEVYQACLQAVGQCGFRTLEASPGAGRIEARSRMGLRSWGENITITVSSGGRVNISSTCRGVQVIDYGKNKANVNALLAAIGQHLPAPPQQ